MALSILDAAIAARSAVLDGMSGAADINQKLERMLRDPEPVYRSPGSPRNTTTAPRDDEKLSGVLPKTFGAAGCATMGRPLW